ERRFVLTRLLDVTGEAEQAEALAALGAHVGEPVVALQDDRGDGGDRLDIVDHGGSRIQTRHSRERGLAAWLTAPALEAVEKGGFLAADVGARAGVDGDVQVEAGAMDVLAEVPGRVGLLDRAQESTVDVDHLAAEIDEGVV